MGFEVSNLTVLSRNFIINTCFGYLPARISLDFLKGCLIIIKFTKSFYLDLTT